MVDFQSRDTRRAPKGAESDEETEDSSNEPEPDAATEDSSNEPEPSEKTKDPLADSEPSEETKDPLADSEPDEATEDYSNEPEPDEETEDYSNEPEPDEATEDYSNDPEPTDTGVAEPPTDVDTSSGAAESDPETTTSAGDATRSIGVAVVTVGETDPEPLERTVTDAFESAGHGIATRERLRGGYDGIQQVVDTLVGRGDVDVVVTVGGVGLTAADVTIRAVHPLLEKALPGFGEAFRSRLAEDIGTGIVRVRSAAGVSEGTLVVCLPGHGAMVQLAVHEILLAEAPELVAAME